MLTPLSPRRAELFLFRAPITEPIVTNFGSIPARVALLIRIEDRDGAHGWGEVWANFPPTGAEHKVRLLEQIVLPGVLGRTWPTPQVPPSSSCATSTSIVSRAACIARRNAMSRRRSNSCRRRNRRTGSRKSSQPRWPKQCCASRMSTRCGTSATANR